MAAPSPIRSAGRPRAATRSAGRPGAAKPSPGRGAERPPLRRLLRSELRFRYDFNDTDQPGQEGFGDAIFSLGLMLPFGR